MAGGPELKPTEALFIDPCATALLPLARSRDLWRTAPGTLEYCWERGVWGAGGLVLCLVSTAEKYGARGFVLTDRLRCF